MFVIMSKKKYEDEIAKAREEAFERCYKEDEYRRTYERFRLIEDRLDKLEGKRRLLKGHLSDARPFVR